MAISSEDRINSPLAHRTDVRPRRNRSGETTPRNAFAALAEVDQQRQIHGGTLPDVSNEEYNPYVFAHVAARWSNREKTYVVTAWYGQWKHLLQALYSFWQSQESLIPSDLYSAIHPMLHALSFHQLELEKRGEVRFRVSSKWEREQNPPEYRSLGIPFTGRQIATIRDILPIARDSYPWPDVLLPMIGIFDATREEHGWYTLNLAQMLPRGSADSAALCILKQSPKKQKASKAG